MFTRRRASANSNQIPDGTFDRPPAEAIVKQRYRSEGPQYLEKIIQASFGIPEPRAKDVTLQPTLSRLQTCLCLIPLMRLPFLDDFRGKKRHGCVSQCH
jgi:hypothetical protein